MAGRAQGVEVPAIAERAPLQGVAQVLPQVASLANLDRLGRPVPHPCGREPTPSAANALETGGRLPPERDRWGRAHREQRQDLRALKIPPLVPQRRPRRQAQASSPITRGAANVGQGA
jgi:hypothetical protein